VFNIVRLLQNNCAPPAARFKAARAGYWKLPATVKHKKPPRRESPSVSKRDASGI